MAGNLKFTKYSGAGNDFIMIDNFTKKEILNYSAVAMKLCPRGVAVGGDGLIGIETSEKADIKMVYVNSDGSKAGMCGNGARCAAMFAYRSRFVNKKMKIETISGVYDAEIIGEDTVKIKMSVSGDPLDKNIVYEGLSIQGCLINSGVPHFVCEHDPGKDLKETGHYIRYHDVFSPEGTNVDFIKIISPGNISIRTYERGVEGETLACGTGAVASGLYYILKYSYGNEVSIITASGVKLLVAMCEKSGNYHSLYLTGEAREIFTAETGRDMEV